jgi:hypothetical protein
MRRVLRINIVAGILLATVLSGSADAQTRAGDSSAQAPSGSSLASEILYGSSASVPAVLAPGSSQSSTGQQIAALAGLPEYSSQFGGMATNGGSVVVNVTPNSSALQSALAADFPAGSYALNTVTTSLFTLESDVLDMSRDSALTPYDSLSSSPFVIISLAPVPTDTVQATVIGDTKLAQATLESLYPTIPLSVVEDSSQLGFPEATSKSNDTVGQWTGGDEVNIGAHDCTDNFAFQGNGSGNLYEYTAVHCTDSVGETIANGGHTIGHVTSQYGYNPYGFSYDFASFQCNTCNNGFVWYNNSGGRYTVSADCGGSCYSGQQVTMDPSTANGQPGVEQPNYSVQWSGPGTVYNGTYWVAGIEFAENNTGSNQNGCPGGASGAPVYQRHANGTVWGAGLIDYNGGPGVYNQCYYETTTTIDNAANATLWL